MNRMKIKSEIKNITLVENLIDKIIEDFNVSSDVYGKVLLAVVEGVNNAILHGNRGEKEKDVIIDYDVNPKTIQFNILDQGIGFDYTNLPDPTLPENLERASGRGVFLMKHLADEFEFNESGNEVRLTFNLD